MGVGVALMIRLVIDTAKQAFTRPKPPRKTKPEGGSDMSKVLEDQQERLTAAKKKAKTKR